MAFSPDYRYLAVGARNGYVNIYDAVNWQLQPKLQCYANGTAIVALDWDAHNRYIRANNEKRELFCFEISTDQRELKIIYSAGPKEDSET